MSTRQTPESGLRVDRIEYIRENTTGEIPADPDWQYHSDNYLNFNWSPSPDASRRDGLGTPDAVDHDVGNESHDLTVAYDLQVPIVDANGDPNDASGDAWLRDEYNQIPNTHAVVSRESRGPSSEDPSGVSGARTYTVAKGCYPEASMEADPEEDSPIPMEVSYTAEKARSYEILQPETSTEVAVQSTSSDDTTQSVTIEDEGASTTETLSLDGTNAIGGSATFGNIDAVSLDAETEGDIELYIWDATNTTTEAQLATIHGGLHYSNDGQSLEGDLGVPALGAGSHATAIGTSYEHFLGDSVQRAGNGIAYDLNNVTVEVDNNYDTTSRSDSVRYRINEGNRSISISADVIGERESHHYIMQSLTAEGDDITWTLDNTEFTFNSSAVTDSPERTRETDDAAAAISVGFEPEGEPAISITQV